ncbi:MAG: SpoVG family protein [Clostridiales Family XIII bacterium]|jgi:stage V sporulation protein G|nr:SpoVG family protein [Clostridiales Family XIII bacterium]
MGFDIRIDYIFDGKDNKLRAYASADIGEEYAVHGIRVVKGDKGNIVYMPQQKGSDGKFHDVFHPVTREGREEMTAAVLKAYSDELKNRMSIMAEQMQEAQAAAVPDQEVSPEEAEYYDQAATAAEDPAFGM